MNSRTATLAAGPVALLSLLLFVVAVGVEGFESDLALARSPIATASSVVGMVALVLLLLGLLRMSAELTSLRAGSGRVGVVVAFIGTALSLGGQWSMVFVVPGLAGMDDQVAEATTGGIPLVVGGYIASFLVLAVGWILVAVALLRSAEVPKSAAVLLVVAGVICIVPLPVRFFLIAAAVSAMEARVHRSADPVPDRVAVTV